MLRPQRCTVDAVVPVLPAKSREGSKGWLLLRRQCCTVAAAVVSHERFRAKTTTTAVLRRRPRETRRAHLRLVPGWSASLAPDSQSRAAVMWPQLLWLRAKQMMQWGMTVVLLINFHRLGRFIACFFFVQIKMYKSTLRYVLSLEKALSAYLSLCSE